VPNRSVLFLVADPEGPSARFRVLQYAQRLRALGVAVEVETLASSLRARLRAIAKAARFRTVVVQRVLLTPPEWWLLRLAAPDYLYDFDDAILFRDSASGRFDSRQRRARFRRMVGGASRVIAGNDYLAGLARRYQADVTVIPTAIDLAPYDAPIEPSDEPAICWIGTAVNLMYLRPLLSVLAKLRVRGSGVKLKIVSDGFVQHAGLEVVCKRWNLQDEARDIMSCQVGIMPLPDDPWTRGKCALKILQYFAARRPVVCSPVGSNLSVVEQGRSGYFASAADEWRARLEELLADAEKRRAFGRCGRETVESRYSVEENFAKLRAALGLESS
jgi:glycosyltransferase involved in cell wall biosynthesis